MLQVVANTPKADDTPRLLFVDDEPRVLNTMRAMFRREYRVWTANSADEALSLLENQPVDVVVSDQRMPGTTGVEMLTRIKLLAPNTVRILLTGYADLSAIEASINEGEVFRYLMKPCPPDELREAVALAVDASRRMAVDDLPTVPESSKVVSFPGQPESGRERPAEAQATVPEYAAEVIEPAEAEAETDADASATGAVVEPAVASEEQVTQPAAEAVAPPLPERLSREVDLLVLTRDDVLLDGIAKANQRSRRIHSAWSVADALQLLAAHPIGVLITDIAVEEAEICSLTETLKQQVPELVTIIASDRSDAAMLIQLINRGQIFRFLLKPVQPGQCRLWLNSAVLKFQEVARSPEALRQHMVASVPPATERRPWFGQLQQGLDKIRQRMAAWKQRS